MSNYDKCKNTYTSTNTKPTFPECNTCGGRLHQPDCTTRKVRGRDCIFEGVHDDHDTGLNKTGRKTINGNKVRGK